MDQSIDPRTCTLEMILEMNKFLSLPWRQSAMDVVYFSI